MGYEYYTIENALYGHKTELLDCLRQIPLKADDIITPMFGSDRWEEVTGSILCSNKLIWLYPPDGPSVGHTNAAEHLRKVARDKYPGEAFTEYLSFFPDGDSGTRVRTYAAPDWLSERYYEWRNNFDTVQSARKQIYPTGVGYMAVEVGSRHGVQNIWVVGEVKNH